MAKRFYLATQKDSIDKAAPLLDELKNHGWERTFAWSGQSDSQAGSHGELAVAELAGVQGADVLIVLLPGGYGTHVEIGAALALGKLVILHAPDDETLTTPYPCVFHYHPGVKILISKPMDVAAILAALPPASE